MDKKIVVKTKPVTPVSKHTLRFVENCDAGRHLMPVVLHTSTGPEIGKSSSYNSFDSKDAAKKFIKAQRDLAAHYGLSDRFDKTLEGFALERIVSYSTRESI